MHWDKVPEGVRMILEKYYENPEILHVNCEENRCYYMPLSSSEKETGRNLSGFDWKFSYYECVEDVPEFYKKDVKRRLFSGEFCR